MSKTRQGRQTETIGLLLGAIATMLASLGAVSIDWPWPWLGAVFVLGMGVIVYLLFKIVAGKRFVHVEIMAKTLSVFTVAALITCAYAAVKSMWIDPFDPVVNRFVFENIATGAGYAAIVFILLLTALQRDAFWFTRKRTVTFDERELRERQQVLEVSYKISTLIILAASFYCATTIWNVPAIVARNHGVLPGHMMWLPYLVLMAIVAVPLIVASWRRVPKKK